MDKKTSSVSQLWLIPCNLYPGVLNPLPDYLLQAVQQCRYFFVEDLRSARRFLKALWPAMVIDDYQWVAIGKNDADAKGAFKQALQSGHAIGLLSEAGCPGVADPGEELVAIAQQQGVEVKPLVGPNSILLALMGSGLNGNQFAFHGYLPIDTLARRVKLMELQTAAITTGATQLFIETPYRNNPLAQSLLDNGDPNLLLCLAVDLTAPTEMIKTKSISAWRAEGLPALHKRPCIFLIGRR